MPTAIGATTITTIPAVITITARTRRPPRRLCTARIMGHVATTIMVAQISAGRNGRSTQNVAAISPPSVTTASRIRVTSHDKDAAVSDFTAMNVRPSAPRIPTQGPYPTQGPAGFV